MGYYTAYSLCMYGDDDIVDRAEKELLKVSADKAGNIDGDVRELISAGGTYAKLYDISEWISVVAPKFPEVLIILTGDGEDSDDMWEERWKGNEHEFQKAIIPPFTNKNLLTEYEKTKC